MLAFDARGLQKGKACSIVENKSLVIFFRFLFLEYCHISKPEVTLFLRLVNSKVVITRSKLQLVSRYDTLTRRLSTNNILIRYTIHAFPD